MSFADVVPNAAAVLQHAERDEQKRQAGVPWREATNEGPMVAGIASPPWRAICRPKIHAVTVCTRMAMGRAKRDTMAILDVLASSRS